jgi:hypothetical protein
LLGLVITWAGYSIADIGGVWWCLLPYLIFGGAPLIAYGLQLAIKRH